MLTLIKSRRTRFFKEKCMQDVKKSSQRILPGDFRSWEFPQTLPVLFIGPFVHVELFENLKFAVISITNIQSTVLSSSKSTAAIDLAFKQRLINNKPSYYY